MYKCYQSNQNSTGNTLNKKESMSKTANYILKPTYQSGCMNNANVDRSTPEASSPLGA